MVRFRLRVLLAMHDMNQKSLAIATGIRPATISAICNGTAKYLSVDVLDKICAALQCQPGDLIEHIPDKM